MPDRNRSSRSKIRTSISNEPNQNDNQNDMFTKSKSWTGYQSLIPEEMFHCREPGCECRVQPHPSQQTYQGHLPSATTTGGKGTFYPEISDKSGVKSGAILWQNLPISHDCLQKREKKKKKNIPRLSSAAKSRKSLKMTKN